ncbi:MAG: hypothetical protein CSA79_06350 [Thiothrix nivea]|nr:MAG: hypothetical protein CSA79_06350 [Thiothrix nivea]
MHIAPAEKTEFSKYEIPLNEGKAKQWVDSLSIMDAGESTRRVFHGLVDFNRRVVPPLTRIRIAERLQPKFEVLRINLQRHLTCQSFPLSTRSQKISDLNQSLLLEYAGLYQLAALDMLNQDMERKKSLQVAIFRVIDYLGKYLLSAYMVYARTRETVWHDIHHMYLLASERGLDKLKFNDDGLGNFVHAAVLNNDEPAVIMPYGDLPHSPTVRVFNLRKLVMKLDQLIEGGQYEQSALPIGSGGLSRNLAKRMIFHLTTVRNRQHNRFERNDEIMVIMGMSAVFAVVENASHRGAGMQRKEEDLLFNKMLYGEPVPDDEESAEKLMELADRECGVRVWRVINSSVGGYGLHWNNQGSSPAKVGELVGLRDMRQKDNPWMTGVVKWLEYLPKQGLYCGVELLSVETQICEVQAIANRQLKHSLPMQGLLLPEIEGLRTEPVLVLPAYVFVSGDKLTIRQGEEEQWVALTTLDECLGTFAHFHFKTVNPELEKKEDDGFADLWNTL